MRFLLEIVVAAGLIALSWNKSFKQWASEAPVVGTHFSQPAAAPSSVSTTKPSAPLPPKSFTGHILYTDEHGKSYWMDAQGKRHYQP
jgi:hypothetical protein